MADDIRTCRDLDERLTPYVDGEDTAPAHEAVAQHLHDCPSCQSKAGAEIAARDIVQGHRDALAAHAPATLKARCAGVQPAAGSRPSSVFRLPSSVVRKWAPLSVAATLVLAVAGVFVFGLNDRVQALAASLAVDHVKCFKIAGTNGHADAIASEAAWQQDQGWPIVVPATDTAQQLTLVEVRRCLSSDGRVAHMMYTWHGEPLSVYVLQDNAGRNEPARIVRKMGQQAVIWCAGQRTYAVVSGDATRNLTPIVDYLRTRVQ